MRLLAVLAVILIATGVIGCNVIVKTSAAASSPVYWDRPWAEHLLVTRDVVGVSPIVDARCAGVGAPRFTVHGVRRFRLFDCKVLTSVGGRYPWVAVTVTPTGSSSFVARAS